MSDQSDAALAESLLTLLRPVATELAAELLEVEVAGPTGRRLVRVTADAASDDAEVGLDIDAIAVLSRRLGSALDEHDPIAGGYTLEVSSPGADRSLRRPRDFARNLGRDLRVTRTDDPTVVTGRLLAADEVGITLETGQGQVVVALVDIDDARVALPW